MEQVELSVITVCYNSEKTIRKTIESIGKQMTDEVEYLLIDGKSNDKTLEIIKEEQKKYPIEVVSEPDEGIYDAMNKGVRLAKGKWLLYINSDDVLKPDILKQIIPVLKSTIQDECIATDVEMRRMVDSVWYSRIWKAEDVSNKVNLYLPFCHQGMYIRKKTLQELKGFDNGFGIAADWDLVLRMYKAGKKFHIEHKVNAEFLEGGTSNKRMVYEKHQIRVKNKSYFWVAPGLLFDVKNRLKSELGKIIFGDKKEKIAVKRNYTRLGI